MSVQKANYAYKLYLKLGFEVVSESEEEFLMVIMKYPWIDEYLLSKAGVTKDLQKEWNWIRYQIGGKMFAAVCMDDNNEPYYITLKLEPVEGDFLRTKGLIG